MSAARTFAFWIGRVCRQAREHTNAKPYDIATLIRKDPKTVVRFEEGHTLAGLDDYLAAYAAITGRDPLGLIEEAVSQWREGGLLPALPERDDNAASVAQQELEAFRQRQQTKKRRNEEGSSGNPNAAAQQRTSA